MELNKITRRLVKRLQQESIEVFEYHTAYPPKSMPPTVRDCNALIYKHNERWYCTYIPENQRVIVSMGKTMEESMRNFDSKYKEAVKSSPDYLEIDRVYNMLKFEEVRHIFYQLVARLPDSDIVTLGAISSWGDTLDGEETLDFLKPYLKRDKDSYKVIAARDDIEEITERIKSGEPHQVDNMEDDDESFFEEQDYEEESTDEDDDEDERTETDEQLNLSESKQERVSPDVISTILTEAHYLMSYTESCYIQATDIYNINTIEEIRNLSAQIALLKVKMEAELNDRSAE